MRFLIMLMLVGVAFAHSNPDQVIAARPQAGKDRGPSGYRGKVVSLTPTTVTIKPEGDLKETSEWRSPDGTLNKRFYIQDNTQPPRVFVFSQELLKEKLLFAGLPSFAGLPLFAHKVSDLKVGDQVEICCSRIRGIDHCDAVGIYRRPGGKVPPAVEDKNTPDAQRWHNRMNAEQATEEKAVAVIQRIGRRFIR